MREILFRGKKIHGGDWIAGDLLHDYVDEGDAWIWIDRDVRIPGYNDHPNLPGPDQVIPETVGQFTGLTDKNGKRIFEGDFVRWPGKKEIGIVQYGEFNCSCCDGVFGWHFGTEDIRDHDSYEVVGNIHDNPELMREAQ